MPARGLHIQLRQKPLRDVEHDVDVGVERPTCWTGSKEDVKRPRLTQRGRMYWFRARVPADLRPHYAPKTEIIVSLKTSDPRDALGKMRVEPVKVDQEFKTARGPSSPVRAGIWKGSNRFCRQNSGADGPRCTARNRVVPKI